MKLKIQGNDLVFEQMKVARIFDIDMKTMERFKSAIESMSVSDGEIYYNAYKKGYEDGSSRDIGGDGSNIQGKE
jgi:hypothetical protein|tara:strand:+ start:18 stop:239 length:222 start_codon:yes stop_codon:yes gene_type:complete